MSEDEKGKAVADKAGEIGRESSETAEKVGMSPSEAPAESDEADDMSGDEEASASASAPTKEEDLDSPEAIARRVAALGEEDESERQARLEEEKLAERRSKQKGAGKRGLEAAASKRLAKIGDKPLAPRPVSRAVPNDPLLQKTNEFTKWARDNKQLVSGFAAVAVILLVGFGVRAFLAQRKEGQASEILAEAVADQRGRIVADPGEEPEGFHDPTPSFKTAAERQDAALAKYREVETRYAGTGAAYLARLSEGSLLLDKRDADQAIAAFTDVRNSPLATADAEVRGRALEGLGFAYELKAAGGDAAKLDDALKAFRELENTDVKGFKELGMYHQARVFEAKGDKDKAKELLKSVHERVTKPGEGHTFPYLENVADDRLRALDPTALPAKPSMSMGAGPGQKMSDAKMRQMMEQIQKQMKEQAEKKAQGGK